MSRWNYALILGGALAAALACDRTPRSDAMIAKEVRDELRDAGDVASESITVQAMNGEVTLEGVVPTEATKERAEDIADDVKGVTRVANQLRVAGTAPPPVSTPPPGADAPSPTGPGTAPSPSTMP